MRNGPSSQPIGELETMLAGWLETPGDVSGELARLREALNAGALASDPPTPDPDDAQRSSAELRALLDGFADAPRARASTTTFGPTRVGYVLDSDSEDATARVVPAFARALAAHIVQSEPPGYLDRQFPDLWLVDLALWHALGKADARHLAAAWLRSPGRRLLRDLATLVPPGESAAEEHAASLHSGKRAAGLDEMPRNASALAAWLDQERPPRWRELHTAVPGLLMRYWQPHDGDVITAFRRLDRGSPCTIRGAALGWLLGRAAREPYYEVDGIRRDLRDDLPVRLAAALAPDLAAERSSGAALQAVLLQHASRITSASDQDEHTAERVVTAWGLAQWMYKCLVRSPFYGSDEERLWAELHAHLGLAAPVPASDPLDPARVGPLTPARGSDGLDIDELAIVSGILCHFTGPGPHIDPVPLPVVHFLRRLAIRPLRPGEANAEETFVPPAVGTLPETLGMTGNALGWQAPHLAPPWVARRFLTDRRMPWLARAVAPEVVTECLEHLARRPATYAWFGFTVYSEGHTLHSESRTRIAESWRALVRRRQAGDRDVMDMPGPALAALAIGVLPMLTPEERAQALQLADLTSPEWRPFLLDAYAEAAARDGAAASARDALHVVWQRALDTLLQTVEDPQRPTRERLQSAFMVLRRSASAADAGPILKRLAQATSSSPFREHAPLQREIRRLGLHTVSSSA